MENLILNKCFMAKTTAFKVQLTKDKECYFHTGQKSADKWSWVKAKMNTAELGMILKVLKGEKNSTSFYHKFNEKETKIWVNRKEDYVFIRIEKISKSLTEGEQEELKVLLEYIILRKNLIK